MTQITRNAIALAVGLAFGGAALAQSAAPTRAEVKADAAAKKASAPKGELSTPNQDKGDGKRAMPAAGSGGEKDRASVKAEAADANKPGSNKPKGQASQKDQDKGVTTP